MDNVNHPEHYISETGLETIDVIEAFTFDLKGIEATDTGNIVKYISRWKKKNGLEDLKKARWYLNHLIEHVEKLEKENDEPSTPRLLTMPGIFFESRFEAESFTVELEDKVNANGHITIHDLYDLYGKPSKVWSDTFGWDKDDMAHARIQKINGVYRLLMVNKNYAEKENEK